MQSILFVMESISNLMKNMRSGREQKQYKLLGHQQKQMDNESGTGYTCKANNDQNMQWTCSIFGLRWHNVEGEILIPRTTFKEYQNEITLFTVRYEKLMVT